MAKSSEQTRRPEPRRLDWELIESEFRTGQFSIRALATRHECSDAAIRKRRDKFGWKQDLTKKVAQAAKTALIRDSVEEPDKKNDQEIAEAAARRVVEVIRGHRKNLGRLSDIVESLIVKLEEMKKESMPSPKLLEMTISIYGKLIGLEREAFNIQSYLGSEKEDETRSFDLSTLTDDQLLLLAGEK